LKTLTGVIVKKILITVMLTALVLPQICLADEAFDAQYAIEEAETLLETMDSMGYWVGPPGVLKKEAEYRLQLAKETLSQGNCSSALQHALLALQYAKGAIGLRGWSLLPGMGYAAGCTTSSH
jgi:hypothetical protein